jgi:hypothetical protein
VRRGFIGLAAMCVFAVALRADQVTLKNGDRLTGAIVKCDGKTLLIKTELAGDVNIAWAAITEIVSSQNLHLGLKDGQTVVGTITTSDGKFAVATKSTGTVETPKDAVTVVRNDAEQATFDAEAERLRHPHLTDFWSGLLDTGLSSTSGNSSTVSFTLAAKAARETTRDKLSVYANSVYAKENNTSPSETTAHAINGGVRLDVNISERLFVFGFTDLQYDAFQHLDCAMCWAAVWASISSRPRTRSSIFLAAAISIRNIIRLISKELRRFRRLRAKPRRLPRAKAIARSFSTGERRWWKRFRYSPTRATLAISVTH